MKYYVADAFSSVALGGNPSGIIILEDGMDYPEDQVMQDTAMELNHAETIFVKQIDKDTFQFRFFTPEGEVPFRCNGIFAAFCALGAAGILSEDAFKTVEPYSGIVGDEPENIHEFKCVTAFADLKVILDDHSIYIEMDKPEFIENLTDQESLEEIHALLGVEPEKIITDKNKNFSQNELPCFITATMPDLKMPILSQEIMELFASQAKTVKMDINLDNIDIELSSDQEINLTTDSVMDEEIAMDMELINALCNDMLEGGPAAELLNSSLATEPTAESHNIKEIGTTDNSPLAMPSLAPNVNMSNRPAKLVGLIQNVCGQLKIKIGGTGAVLMEGEIFI